MKKKVLSIALVLALALLNMLIEQEYDVVVAFVNYHKREASKYEIVLPLFCWRR